MTGIGLSREAIVRKMIEILMATELAAGPDHNIVSNGRAQARPLTLPGRV